MGATRTLDRVEIRDGGDEAILLLPTDDGLHQGQRQVVYVPVGRVGELTMALLRYARSKRLVPTVVQMVREAVRRK